MSSYAWPPSSCCASASRCCGPATARWPSRRDLNTLACSYLSATGVHGIAPAPEAREGGVISYGFSPIDQWRQVTTDFDRILRAGDSRGDRQTEVRYLAKINKRETPKCTTRSSLVAAQQARLWPTRPPPSAPTKARSPTPPQAPPPAR